MKGSPILATALACLIMLGMYFGMRVLFFKDATPPENDRISQPVSTGAISVYAEIYFSHQPKHFSITHPASGSELLKVKDADDIEWSGELKIPLENLTSDEIEILGEVEWATDSEGYQFMQVIISPDDHEAQTHTLRAEGEISDIMKFQWKEEK